MASVLDAVSRWDVERPGLGSVLDILQSDEVQTSVAVMVQLTWGKMDKYVCCCARGTTFVAFAILRTPIVRVQVEGSSAKFAGCGLRSRPP